MVGKLLCASAAVSSSVFIRDAETGEKLDPVGPDTVSSASRKRRAYPSGAVISIFFFMLFLADGVGNIDRLLDSVAHTDAILDIAGDM